MHRMGNARELFKYVVSNGCVIRQDIRKNGSVMPVELKIIKRRGLEEKEGEATEIDERHFNHIGSVSTE